MNQRGIELYKQACEFAYTTIGKEHAETAYFQGVVAGKFAELMTQECTRVIQQEWYDLNNADTPDNETPRQCGIRLGKKSECIVLIEKIKKHFGIK